MTSAPIIKPTDHAINRAVDAILSGSLVAFPTETVYGLGADATNETAIARIFDAKGRPRFNPLISHVASLEAAFQIGVFSRSARVVAESFWPGPITLVVERAANCPVAWLTSAGLERIALRVPAHPLAHELLQRAGRPIGAPSANLSGRISPTRAEHVESELGNDVAMILDGGACEIGLESTVLDLSGATPLLLRPGAVTKEDIEEITGHLSIPAAKATIVSPGMLASHYAPNCPVRLEAEAPIPGEAYLAFGGPEQGCISRTLSETGNLVEAAANLFNLLRALDQPGVKAIAVAPIPNHGLGAAINDRLTRAAAPR
ncbi:MAG: threonylcarbamoyl-AMP synthase [Rhodospirillaceae bacterium]|nr:threonylcarbamoyl-AMP synthase [Rhodospirillaceae bacterium]